MKPDWDKLMAAYAGSSTQLVGDVDCTAAGKPLCSANGVGGYPTLKWGDPSDLQDYKGGRDFNSLEAFALDKLKPSCSPSNMDMCDDIKKAQIKQYQGMSIEDLEASVAKEKQRMEDAEKRFKDAHYHLELTYNGIEAAYNDAVANIKAGGLPLMQAVKAEKDRAAAEEGSKEEPAKDGSEEEPAKEGSEEL